MPSDHSHSTTRRLHTYGKKQLQRFQQNLDLALSAGDVEAVHDLRVAARRLSVPLELLCRDDVSHQNRRALRDLNKIRRAFRRVRDYDVLLESLLNRGAPHDRIPAEVLAQVEGELTRRREKEWKTASNKVSGKALRHIDRAVDSVRRADARQSADALAALRNAVMRRAAILLQRGAAISAGDSLHPVRICTKELRYAAEMAGKVGIPGTQELIAALQPFQELIGAWNDAVYAARRLSRLACKKRILTSNSRCAPTLFEAAAAHTQHAAEQRALIIDAWIKLEPLVRLAAEGGFTPSSATAAPHASETLAVDAAQ